MGIKTVGRFVRTTPLTLAAGENVTFLNNATSNCALEYQNGQILVNMPGLYMIYANFVATSATAGAVATIQLQENGVDVPGATASSTIAEANGIENLSFNAIATEKEKCGDGFAAFSFVNEDGAMIYNNANVFIENIA